MRQAEKKGDSRTLVRWAGRWIAIGALATMALATALVWTTDLPALDSLFLPVLLFLLPVLSAVQVPFIQEEEELARVPAYVASSLSILALGAVSLFLGLRLGGVEGMGLAAPDPGGLVIWTVLLTGCGVLLMELFHRLGVRESPILRWILPRSRRERRLFLGVSASAGLGEELAFRGYALVAVHALGFGVAPAIVVSSVAFGFLHAYQGWTGIVRTAILGVVLGWSVVVTGSLWPAIAAHFFIDVLGGLVLGPRYLDPKEEV